MNNFVLVFSFSLSVPLILFIRLELSLHIFCRCISNVYSLAFSCMIVIFLLFFMFRIFSHEFWPGYRYQYDMLCLVSLIEYIYMFLDDIVNGLQPVEIDECMFCVCMCVQQFFQ